MAQPLRGLRPQKWEGRDLGPDRHPVLSESGSGGQRRARAVIAPAPLPWPRDPAQEAGAIHQVAPQGARNALPDFKGMWLVSRGLHSPKDSPSCPSSFLQRTLRVSL